MPLCIQAQDNYEIQVYGAETVGKHALMAELHSNYTFNGTKQAENGVIPSNHIFHETIEITKGITDWFETALYLFNAVGNEHRTDFVGSHLRLRIRLPEKYHFPVGLGLSVETGIQKRTYSEDDGTLEIRPIIDKQLKRWYIGFNPVLDKSLHGLNSSRGFVFSPNAKVSYKIIHQVEAGIEYYGSINEPQQSFFAQHQQQQLFITTDLHFSPDWEFNCGYGFGLTGSTDKAIFKVIVGRKFH